MNQTITTFIIIIFAIQISAQAQCYKRTITTVKSKKYSANSIQTDTVCNDRVIWSKTEYPDSKPHDLNPFKHIIRTYQYDSIGRISVVVTNEYIDDKDGHQAEFEYFEINNRHSKNKFDKKIESIVFNILINEEFDFPRKSDFYYEYSVDTLKIKKVEYDYLGLPKNKEAQFQDNGLLNKKTNRLNLINTFKDESDIRVTLLKNNRLKIWSAIIPQKPTLLAGYWRKRGINCVIQLNANLDVIELDQYWMGKTIYKYKNGKLISKEFFKNGEIQTEHIVESKIITQHNKR